MRNCRALSNILQQQDKELNFMPRNALSVNPNGQFYLASSPRNQLREKSDKIWGGRSRSSARPEHFAEAGKRAGRRAAPPAGFVPAQKGGKPRRRGAGPSTAVVVTESLDWPQTR